MKRKWTIESALRYVGLVETGKLPVGLTYCSARSYLMNHMPIVSKAK